MSINLVGWKLCTILELLKSDINCLHNGILYKGRVQAKLHTSILFSSLHWCKYYIVFFFWSIWVHTHIRLCTIQFTTNLNFVSWRICATSSCELEDCKNDIRQLTVAWGDDCQNYTYNGVASCTKCGATSCGEGDHHCFIANHINCGLGPLCPLCFLFSSTFQQEKTSSMWASIAFVF